MIKHLVIPDCQVKPGIPLEHLDWIGELIVKERPDVIVCLGDFADMPSLSSYDKGKKSFEGRRYIKDIQSATIGMGRLLRPLKEFNRKAIDGHRAQYKPRMVLTLGNHEHRIERACENQAELDGVIGYHDLPYQDWEVYDFLKPVEVDGVTYVHYLQNKMTGNPVGGTGINKLKTTGCNTTIVGHKQTLEVATMFNGRGQQQWFIECGAAYLHDEEYKGYQGNHHFRGVLILDNVREGNFDLRIISLDSLRSVYDIL